MSARRWVAETECLAFPSPLHLHQIHVQAAMGGYVIVP